MIILETETERTPGLTMTSVKNPVAIKFLMIAIKPLLKCIQQRRTHNFPRQFILLFGFVYFTRLQFFIMVY